MRSRLVSTRRVLAVIDGNETAIEAAGVVLHSYTAPGDDHGIFEWPKFYEVEVNGVTLVEWVDALLAGQPLDDVHCVDCNQRRDRRESGHQRRRDDARRLVGRHRRGRASGGGGQVADSTRSDRLHNLLVEDFGLQCTNLQNQYMRMHGRMQLITGINTALLPGLGRRPSRRQGGGGQRLAAALPGRRPPPLGDRLRGRLRRQLSGPALPRSCVDDGTRARRHSRRGAIDHGTLVAHRHEPGTVRQLIGEIGRAGRCSGPVEPAHVTEPDCAVRHPPAGGALARVHRRGWSSSCCCCSSGPDRAVGTAATRSGGPRRRSRFREDPAISNPPGGHGRRSSNASLRRRGTEDAVDQSVLVVSAAGTLVLPACGDDDDVSTTEAPPGSPRPPSRARRRLRRRPRPATPRPPGPPCPAPGDADLVIWTDETRAAVIEPIANSCAAMQGANVAVQQVAHGDLDARSSRLHREAPVPTSSPTPTTRSATSSRAASWRRSTSARSRTSTRTSQSRRSPTRSDLRAAVCGREHCPLPQHRSGADCARHLRGARADRPPAEERRHRRGTARHPAGADGRPVPQLPDVLGRGRLRLRNQRTARSTRRTSASTRLAVSRLPSCGRSGRRRASCPARSRRTS